MKVKILSIICLIALLVSCDKYSREKYPQLVSYSEKHQYINSCYSAEFENLNKIPSEIHNKIITYLKTRLGDTNFQKIEFDNGYVLSDKPIQIERTENEKSILALLGQDKEKTDCDTIIAFPIYSVDYQFKKPEIGIEKMGINLLMDKNGEVIKDIDFPKSDYINKIIPIDSVHAELIRRKIPYKKLNIHLWYDKSIETFFWSTNTLISEGSIAGPSCIPEVKHHFKINASNGEITNYNSEKREEYFVE